MTKGQKIKQLRKEIKMSQTELAQRLETTKQTVSKYEKDIITNIPSDKIEAMANIFGVKPQYLQGWEELEMSQSTNFPLYPLSPLTKQEAVSMHVGELIRQKRIELDMTQEQLGNLVGVNRAAINKWETGRVTNLKRETIKKLSEIFQISPALLVEPEPSFPQEIQTAPAEPELSEVKRQLIEVVRSLPEEKVEALYQVAKALVPQDQPKTP